MKFESIGEEELSIKKAFNKKSHKSLEWGISEWNSNHFLELTVCGGECDLWSFT